MPVFFVVAGFFAAFLLNSRGVEAFLRHRFSRIAIPLVCAWIVIFPATFLSMRYAVGLTADPLPLRPDGTEYFSGLPRIKAALPLILMHLWFLYYLLLFSLLASLVAWTARLADKAACDRALDFFERRIHGWGAFAVLALLSGLALWHMEHWRVGFSASPIPTPHVMATYGLFFAFGWLLFKRRASLESFKPATWPKLAAGFSCFWDLRSRMTALK